MNIDRKTTVMSLLALAIGLIAGWLIFGRGGDASSVHDEQLHAQHGDTSEWTCSMHPQIRSKEPGQCPICGMDLVPVGSSDESDANPAAIGMSPTAMQLANISTATVGAMKPVKSVRLNGKVQADERLVYSQSSHIPGRIEKLLVNFTGEYVSRGQPVAHLYSPELVTAQKELFEAMKLQETQPQLLAAAREKLANWKLSDQQIDQIVDAGTVREEFPVLADVSGFVTRRNVKLGDHVSTGDAIYEITDLSRVWVLFDVYESDLSWVRNGDNVSFTVASLPGERFDAKITFLDPLVNAETRVAGARVEIANKQLKLKPGMFASGTVEASLLNASQAITIPKTAVMWTGKRSVVYIKLPAVGHATSFVMREVTLGPALGESYVVESGLDQGEEIVVNGAFSVDAAAQLAGKPSMMNRDGAGKAAAFDHHHMVSLTSQNSTENYQAQTDEEFRQQLTSFVQAYIVLKDALVNGEPEKARKAGAKAEAALASINMSLLTNNEAHQVWMKLLGRLKTNLTAIISTNDLANQRQAFIQLSQAAIETVERFGIARLTVYQQHCPMANSNKGADWLSLETEIRNPYYGEAMLSCGSVEQTFEPIN